MNDSYFDLLLILAGAIVSVIGIAAFVVLRDPAATKRRIEAAFRRPGRPPRTAGNEQYYRPYWTR